MSVGLAWRYLRAPCGVSSFRASVLAVTELNNYNTSTLGHESAAASNVGHAPVSAPAVATTASSAVSTTIATSTAGASCSQAMDKAIIDAQSTTESATAGAEDKPKKKRKRKKKLEIPIDVSASSAAAATTPPASGMQHPLGPPHSSMRLPLDLDLQPMRMPTLPAQFPDINLGLLLHAGRVFVCVSHTLCRSLDRLSAA